jgi:hypothetical protein
MRDLHLEGTVLGIGGPEIEVARVVREDVRGIDREVGDGVRVIGVDNRLGNQI